MSAFLNLNGLSRFLTNVKQLISTKANVDLSDVESTAFANKYTSSQSDLIYTAESSDGVSYTVTVPGITNLYSGLRLNIKFNKVSASTTPTLNVNELGAKNIRQPLSVNNSATAPGSLPTWIGTNCPIVLTYNGTLWKTDFVRPSSNGLYGTVPITSGGTGATTATDALTNLGAASKTYVDEQIASIIQRLEALEN